MAGRTWQEAWNLLSGRAASCSFCADQRVWLQDMAPKHPKSSWFPIECPVTQPFEWRYPPLLWDCPLPLHFVFSAKARCAVPFAFVLSCFEIPSPSSDSTGSHVITRGFQYPPKPKLPGPRGSWQHSGCISREAPGRCGFDLPLCPQNAVARAALITSAP